VHFYGKVAFGELNFANAVSLSYWLDVKINTQGDSDVVSFQLVYAATKEDLGRGCGKGLSST